MRHFFWALLAAPLLLAPIRFQQGEGEIILIPSQSPLQQGRGQPAARLISPTLVSISPTRAPLPAPISSALQVELPAAVAASATVTPIPASASSAPAFAPTTGITPLQAAICVKALTVLDDVAALSLKQGGGNALVNLSIAASLAQTQAAQGQWPNLALLQKAIVPFFTPNRAELQQAKGYALQFCQNPALPPADGSQRLERPR